MNQQAVSDEVVATYPGNLICHSREAECHPVRERNAED